MVVGPFHFSYTSFLPSFLAFTFIFPSLICFRVNMAEKKKYTVELKLDERVEEFGRCYIPKLIMKQEKLSSGMTVILQAIVNGEVNLCRFGDFVGIFLCCNGLGETISF